MKMVLKPMITSIVLGISASIAFAEPSEIAGQADPAFQSAIEDWLHGDDLTALQGLSELAHQDNHAAQMFLGRLSSAATHTIEDLRQDMVREDFLTLTRKGNGSRFPPSWLMQVAEEHTLAWAFANTHDPEASRYLIEAGEYSEQGLALGVLAGASEFELLFQFDAEGLIHPYFKPFLASIGSHAHDLGLDLPDGEGGELAKSYAEAAHIGNSKAERDFFYWDGSHSVGPKPNYLETLINDKDVLQRLTSFAAEDERLNPARDLCGQICPESRTMCTVALRAHWRANAQTFLKYWSSSHSPVEALLSTHDYRESPRYIGDMRSLLQGAGEAPEGLGKLDACFVGFLEQD